jgi:hypothetical protein
VITAAKRISIANCRECVFFLGVNQRPLIVGDNHKLQVCLTTTSIAILTCQLALTGYNVVLTKKFTTDKDLPCVLTILKFEHIEFIIETLKCFFSL